MCNNHTFRQVLPIFSTDFERPQRITSKSCGSRGTCSKILEVSKRIVGLMLSNALLRSSNITAVNILLSIA